MDVSDPTRPPDDLPAPPHPDAATFRRAGHALIDWIADHTEALEQRPVVEPVEPGWVRDQLPPRPPRQPGGLEGLTDELDRVIVPASVHWQHPSFFAYFPSNASYASILGELASAGLAAQGMLWSTSPAMTEVETHALAWLHEALGLPASLHPDGAGGGVIADSASSATLCALLAARARCVADGADPVDLIVATSTHAHSSVVKALRVAGFAADALCEVPCDAEHRMDPVALDDVLSAAVTAGRRPCAVVATVGTTSSGAVDPIPAVVGVARRHGAWVHVDAAWAGAAMICAEHAWLGAGLADVDSWVTNPHKWLLTSFDCSAFYVADRRWLLEALSITPEYLRNAASDSGAVIDYRDWQVPLGRRFRALKLWWVLRAYGTEGLAAHVRRHVAWAIWLADRVAADPRLDQAAPRSLALVCIAHREGDEATQALIDAVAAAGAFVTHTRLDGRLVLRVAIGSVHTDARHVGDLWSVIEAAA